MENVKLSTDLINSCMRNCLPKSELFTKSFQNSYVLATQGYYHAKLFEQIKTESYEEIFLEREKEKKIGFSEKKKKNKFEIKFRIGIIGLGIIGKRLEKLLLQSFKSYQIIVSTRRSKLDVLSIGNENEVAQKKKNKDGREVIICSDSNWVVMESDIIFLCLPPDEFKFFLRDLKTNNYYQQKKSKKIWFSFIPSIPIKKLQKSLGSNLVLKSNIVNKWVIDPPTIEKILSNSKFISFCSPVKENGDNTIFLDNLCFIFITYMEEMGLNSYFCCSKVVRLLFGIEIKDEEVLEFSNEYKKDEKRGKFFYKYSEFIRALLNHFGNKKKLSILFIEKYKEIMYNNKN